MRINPDPRLPREGAVDFTSSLVLRLNQLFRSISAQLNGVSEGRIEAATNAYSAAPTAGKWARGDVIRNNQPAELGSGGAKYVVTGWICVEGGEPGTWRQMRALTGN